MADGGWQVVVPPAGQALREPEALFKKLEPLTVDEDLTPLPMFDSHCHLQMPVFAGDLPDVLERARQDGLEGVVVIGMDPPSSRQAIDLANRHEGVYATVGVHPHDASCLDDDALQALREMAREPRVVAIGETGLDFYRNLSPPAAQRKGVSGAARAGRRAGPAGRHPFATGEPGDLRHPARVGHAAIAAAAPARRHALLRRRRGPGGGIRTSSASCYHSPET